jgi:transposase
METDLAPLLASVLLPSPSDLNLETMTVDAPNKHITLEVTAIQATPSCPRCHTPSNRIHSGYIRTLADLPWAETTVCLHLQVRKCFCSNPACPQRIFTERLPAVVAPWARRTQRLAEQQRHIALALAGAPSQRLSADLDCDASRDTFLRLVRTTPAPDTPTPRCLGVDDWALRKGQTYASIVIDLERSIVIDLLPDRSAETFAQWLLDHPGVEIISRDRAGSYAEGASEGAPDAIQVADRWHLLKNLGDALSSLFEMHRPAIEQHLRPATKALAASENSSEKATPAAPDAAKAAPDQQASVVVPTIVGEPATEVAPSRLPSIPRRSPFSKQKQAEQEQRLSRRHARYEEVCRLREQGWTLSAIADQLGLDRNTVRKYVQARAFAQRQARGPQPSLLDPYKPYILERSPGGCHIGTVILREVEARGYRGGQTTLLAYITQLRIASGLPLRTRCGRQAAPIGEQSERLPSSRGLSWLVLRKAETLDAEEHVRLGQLGEVHSEIATAMVLAQEFATIVRERQHEQLDSWLARTEQSGIAPLLSFAKGIRRDYNAVKAGVTLKYSNGPTEGHVNRLKMLKRHMFGRAKLDLLKKRLMAA